MMMVRMLLLGILLACSLQLCKAYTWKQCGDGRFAVKGVTLSPEPVPAGATAVFDISADASLEVELGTIEMTVTYAGIPIWTQNDDLCQKTACPVPKGAVDVTYTQPFPIFTPPGQYIVKLKGVTGTSPLFCVEVTFQVTMSGGRAAAAAQQAASSALRQVAEKALPDAHRKQLS